MRKRYTSRILNTLWIAILNVSDRDKHRRYSYLCKIKIMLNSLSLLSNAIPAWIGVLTIIALGLVSIYGLFDKAQADKKKSLEKSEDRLVNILQETVDHLELKLDKAMEDIETLNTKVESLQKENETLTDVLQGRDKKTEEFYRQVFDSIKVSQETHTLVSRVASAVDLANTNTARLITLIESNLFNKK